ncbi:hypothetical protein V2J09_018248 [Rumex salicifolius]
MADFDALENPHYNTFPLHAKPTSRRRTGGSNFFCSNFLFRLLFIALFLSALPLFASQPPDFISNSVFAKGWELVHLFIIGIIVSYGLFGRRGTQTHVEIQTPPAFNSPNILHASTIFNFEHQNPCAYGVHGNANVNQARDFRPFGLEPTVVVRPGTHDFDYKPLDLPVRSLRSRVEETDSEICASESEIEADASSSCCCYEEDNESENLEEDNAVNNTSSPTPWNWPNSAHLSYLSSPCVDPEAKHTSFEMFGPSKSESRSMDPKEVSDVYFARDIHEVKHVKTRSSRVSSSKGSSPFSPSMSESPPFEKDDSRRENVEFGSSLMEKRTSSLKSRSMRVHFKENVGDVSLQAGTKCQEASSSDSSPLCSDASRSPTADAENLQRESKMQHLQSLSSPKSSSVSPSWDFLPPSMPESSLLRSAVSEPPPATEMESLQRGSKKGDNLLKEMKSSSIQLGADLDKDVIGKSRTLSRTPHSHRFSIGSFFDRELRKGSKDATKETTKKEKDENGGNRSGKCGWDCLKLDVKPNLTKNALRGKSVRTVRPRAITLEPSCTNEMSPKQKTDDKLRERQDVVIISIGISGKNNSTHAKNQKCASTIAKQERAESCLAEPSKKKERLSGVEDVNEDEDCNSEIDRKADEFIAKFKEQIRLQKVASRISGKH